MPNWFYTDKNGTKRGPISDQQLRTFILQKIITPQTPLETESGHKGLAGQIPGLNFPGSTIEPKSNKAAVAQYRYSSDTGVTPVFPLLTDTSFRELLPETLFLWIIKIVYAIGAVAVILCTLYALFACGASIIGLAHAVAYEDYYRGWLLCGLLSAILALPLICIGGFLAICVLRLSCEWGIITFHYMIVWTIELVKLPKSIRIFLEEKSKRE